MERSKTARRGGCTGFWRKGRMAGAPGGGAPAGQKRLNGGGGRTQEAGGDWGEKKKTTVRMKGIIHKTTVRLR